MKWQDYIISDSNILLGKPVIKGTRISVELILELMENGWTQQQIFESYPALNQESLKAVFAYLREGLEMKLYPAPPVYNA